MKKGFRRHQQGFSLTFKVSLLVTLLITVLMMGMGSLTYVMNLQMLTAQEASQGESMGAFGRELMSSHVAADDFDKTVDRLSFLEEDSKIVQAYVTDPEGEIWAHQESASIGNRMQSRALEKATEEGGIQVQRTFSETVDLPVLLVVVPLKGEAGQVMGYLHFLTDFTPVQSFLTDSAMRWIQLFVAAVLVSLVLVRLIISRAVGKPVHRILNATQQAAMGNFSETLEPMARDELGQLAEGFNQMNQQLGVLFRSVSQSVAEMEYASRSVVKRSESMSKQADQWPVEKQQEWMKEISSNGKRLVRLSDKLKVFLDQFQTRDD